MFTGIIEATGRIESIRTEASGAGLSVDLGPLAPGVAPGDSVAIRGVCLTAQELAGSIARFRVTRETLERTALGGCRAGSAVNLERSLAVGERLGGHIVLGHVDGIARVVSVSRAPNDWRVRFRVPDELRWSLAPKGSIAVDGVSLTVVKPSGIEFGVALVDFTLERTTLGTLRPGDGVNLEGDVLGRWVAHLLGLEGPGAGAQGLSPGKIRELGRFGLGTRPGRSG